VLTGGGHWTRVRAVVGRVGPSMDALCAVCVVELASVRGASVMAVGRTGARAMPVVSDETSGTVEELQFTLGEGPCVDAMSLGRPVLIADLHTAECELRWPAFVPAAVVAGVAAIFTFPLQVGAIRIGALSVYRDRIGGLPDDELAAALVCADAATLLLLSSGVDGHPHVELGRRAVVHQATGMVTAQLGISIDEAFVRLRAHAYVQDRPLDEIAREVVERRLRFDELKD
jgi:hypothetical protein